MDLYAENILDHYRHPRYKEVLPSPTVTHKEENASCGDTIELSLEITDGKITNVGWQGEGCAISQAAMSMLNEELIGKTNAEAATISVDHIHELLGVPVGPRRTKCALLCLHTLKNTLRAAKNEPPQSWTETVAVD